MINRPASDELSAKRSDRDAETAADWVARLAVGEIDEADMTRLRAWLQSSTHRRAFDDARVAWHATQRILDAAAPETGRPIGRAAARRHPGRRWAAVGVGLAASLVVAFLAGRLPAGDLVTTKGQVSQVRLSDGTLAWLDTDSALNLHYSAGERRVELVRGRAWFDVVHTPGRPFRVVVPGGMVTDIGTAFEVERADGQVRVGVSQGAVRTEEGGRITTLTAGHAAWWSTGAAVPAADTAFDADAALAWRSGRIVLDQRPLGQALDEIRRYRPGLIVLIGDKLAGMPVSGTLFVNRLEQGLDTLAASEGLRVTRLPYLTILWLDDRPER